MTYFWSDTVNGDFPRAVLADSMRVNDAGALIFENETDSLYRTPALFIAPGEWKSAWKDAE